MKDKILKFMLFLIIFIAASHIVSLKFYLYFDFWWLDILMHFLGGFWSVLFFFWLLFYAFDLINPERNNFFSIILIAIIFNLFVSLFWEVFEFKLGIALASKNYWPDTITDSLSSFSGGLLAALFFFKKAFKKLENNEF